MSDNCCSTATKHAHHSPEFKKKLNQRLNRIEGQVRGINRMITEDVYCDDILTQIAAAYSALKGVGRMLLEAHVKSCVVDQVNEGRVEVVDELMTTITKLMK